MRFLIRCGLIALATGAFTHNSAAVTIRVAAAVSLKESLEAIAESYKAATGNELQLVFGSSGQLLTQLKAGADVDLFVAASNKQVDELQRGNQVNPLTRRTVVCNELVLVVPANAKDVAPRDFAGLTQARRIAVGEPKTVPAGEYAAQVLDALKFTEALRGKLVYGSNVRQVLAYVEAGEVSAGLVYVTDAREAGDKVRIVAQADPATHAPIVYPGVVLKRSRQPAVALKALDYLSEGEAQRIFRDKGFTTAQSAEPATRPSEPSATTLPSAAGSP